MTTIVSKQVDTAAQLIVESGMFLGGGFPNAPIQPADIKAAEEVLKGIDPESRSQLFAWTLDKMEGRPLREF